MRATPAPLGTQSQPMIVRPQAQRYEMIGLGLCVVGVILGVIGCSAGLGFASTFFMLPGLGVFIYGRALR